MSRPDRHGAPELMLRHGTVPSQLACVGVDEATRDNTRDGPIQKLRNVGRGQLIFNDQRARDRPDSTMRRHDGDSNMPYSGYSVMP